MLTKEETLLMLGREIRFLRNRKGLTQRELSEKVKVCRTYISELEHGKKNIAYILLCKIFNELDYEPIFIIERNN
jgi:transcriptional regulator with XRE-family HTH domain